MTTQVQITKSVSGSSWIITAQILSGADIPSDVFIYENTGTTELGEYFGVVNFQDYSRIQTWTGQVIPVFGNKYIKHTQATIQIPVTLDVASVINNIKSSIYRFKTEYLSGSSTTEIFTI